MGRGHKLILVSAPAGFGKTTLVSQWLDGCGLPVAWVTLDEEDNHLPRLLRYVCAAVRRCRPGACPTLQGLLATIHLPRPEDVADLLVEELSALPDELILVLDDYHRIHAQEVHQLLRHLLRYLPPRLHLVILTRTDPPLLGAVGVSWARSRRSASMTCALAWPKCAVTWRASQSKRQAKN